jgi:hypothetical protein
MSSASCTVEAVTNTTPVVSEASASGGAVPSSFGSKRRNPFGEQGGMKKSAKRKTNKNSTFG